MKLIIFVRRGCCICDKLKNKLNNLLVKSNLKIEEIDIDRFDLYQDRFKKYNLEVPVIALQKFSSDEIIELPRVSPRLKELQLKNWLRKNIGNALNKEFDL